MRPSQDMHMCIRAFTHALHTFIHTEKLREDLVTAKTRRPGFFFSKPEYLIPSEKNYTVFWGGKRNFCHLITRLYDFH